MKEGPSSGDWLGRRRSRLPAEGADFREQPPYSISMPQSGRGPQHQKRTWREVPAMSALPPKAAAAVAERRVRFGPIRRHYAVQQKASELHGLGLQSADLLLRRMVALDLDRNEVCEIASSNVGRAKASPECRNSCGAKCITAQPCTSETTDSFTGSV